jgi:glycosyltransferase involved in cell wall biosynthesis
MNSNADQAAAGKLGARVTIVTPVYNGRDFIVETVESVLSQNVEGLEYIVVDDGSTDGVGDLLAERYGGRLRLVRQVNQGEQAATNRGVAEASADIIAVVNADDPIRPGLIEMACRAFDDDPKLVGVYPDWDMIDEKGGLIQRMITHDFDLRVHVQQHLCLPGPGGFFRRSALGCEAARNPRYRYTGDYDMWARLGLRGRVRRLPHVLATWRRHGAGGSIAGVSPEMARNKIEMIEEFFARPDVPAELKPFRRSALATAYYSAALLAIHDQKIPGRSYMLSSLKLQPFWPRYFFHERRRSCVHVAYVLLPEFRRPANWLARRLGWTSPR